jgi:hypothetical protein
MTKFKHLCTLIWGRVWRLDAATSLNLNERTVRRYAKGEYDPPNEVITDLRLMAAAKAAQLATASQENDK